MPNKQLAVTLSGATVFVTPKISKGYITGLASAALAISGQSISLIDSFTPDASVGNPTPTPVTRVLGTWTKGSGQSILLWENQLKDVMVIGTASAVGAISGDIVTVAWKLV
jgi:hypothetical protein